MQEDFDDRKVLQGGAAATARLWLRLDHALGPIVALTSRVPSDAYTADALGMEHAGNAVVIGIDDLLLTIAATHRIAGNCCTCFHLPVQQCLSARRFGCRSPDHQ